MAGQLAMRYRGGTLDITDKPGGAGPVTDADIAVDAALREMLTAARPGYGWLSEETPDDRERLDRKRVFVVDPIDGTRSFIKGETTWAHSLAIVEDGVATHGVVFLPALDRLYHAARGQGARCNDTELRTSAAPRLAQARVLATKPNLDPRHWRAPVPGFRRSHRPSLAYRLSLVAEGVYDAMMTFRPSWEWDIAAGTVILDEAGARVSDRAGAPLVFNNAHPQTQGIIGAGPDLHRDIVARLVYGPADES